MDVHAVAADAPSWTDKLEAWSTFGAGIAGLAAAIFTLWLLIHSIREAKRARLAADKARSDAEVDRELARKDRERLDNERAKSESRQARAVTLSGFAVDKSRDMKNHIWRIQAVVANFSTEPITDFHWLLELEDDKNSAGPAERHLLVDLGRMTLIGPEEKYEIWHDVHPLIRLSLPGGEFKTKILFLDSQGYAWTRTSEGKPDGPMNPAMTWMLPDGEVVGEFHMRRIT